MTSQTPSRASLSEGATLGLSASSPAIASSIVALCVSVHRRPFSVPRVHRSSASHAVVAAEEEDAAADDTGDRRGREVPRPGAVRRVGVANVQDVDIVPGRDTSAGWPVVVHFSPRFSFETFTLKLLEQPR